MRHDVIDRQEDDGTLVSGSVVTIAAKVKPGIDWAAYIERGKSVVDTARRGDKLPEAVARWFFPGIEEPYRG